MRVFLNDEAVNAVLAWWHELHPAANGRGGNRGGRARLRRAETPLDALLEAETQALIGGVLTAHGSSRARSRAADLNLQTRLAILAMALAQVAPGKRGDLSFAEMLGRTSDGKYAGKEDRRRLSPARFGALLRAADDPENLCRLVRRAVKVSGDAGFNIRKFVRDVLAFDDDTRRDWTFEYYQTHRPGTKDTGTETDLPQTADA
ncbi:type I-E CRISPR-associated protein Cse2/CasB [Stappia sp.]|uniref:type I-E CRISPR-associated protein Cse2/CasB n=1 Tax=Stappia sp. TaxID=1870903 RepID=UPI003D11B69B